MANMISSWLSSEEKILEHLRNSSACLLKCTMKFWAGVRHLLVKQHTRYREPLDPGLKLAATLCHLVSGVKCSVLLSF
ncbi:hypothetical protein DPMN_049292 [Dreissena polymorpha]|uniref:Uncharacterized protein n=1 Tax=Dreissena polymorpha TaxID=45954 RepID=A0A9D4HL61_DREPO|nr:hypothetical protein DPMN_049292 [Dreissena polymorpha]